MCNAWVDLPSSLYRPTFLKGPSSSLTGITKRPSDSKTNDPSCPLSGSILVSFPFRLTLRLPLLGRSPRKIIDQLLPAPPRRSSNLPSVSMVTAITTTTIAPESPLTGTPFLLGPDPQSLREASSIPIHSPPDIPSLSIASLVISDREQEQQEEEKIALRTSRGANPSISGLAPSV